MLEVKVDLTAVRNTSPVVPSHGHKVNLSVLLFFASVSGGMSLRYAVCQAESPLLLSCFYLRQINACKYGWRPDWFPHVNLFMPFKVVIVV